MAEGHRARIWLCGRGADRKADTSGATRGNLNRANHRRGADAGGTANGQNSVGVTHFCRPEDFPVRTAQLLALALDEQRLLLSYGASIYARWITGLPLTDLTAGFKCFRKEVLTSIPLERVRSNGYAFQIEMSFRAWRKGFHLVEVPIVFVDRTEGVSKMSRAVFWEGVWVVWWLRIARILGRL